MALNIKNQEESWSPDLFHSVGSGTIVWRQIPEGILVKTEESERRTRGEPVTLRKIVSSYGREIDYASAISSVPKQLIAGVIAAESHGNPVAERREAHLNDWSIGLTQIITATAQSLAANDMLWIGPLNLEEIASMKPIPRGGDLGRWRSLLGDPRNAISLAAVYLRLANDLFKLKFDPVLCYAAYNAGSPRDSTITPWGVHYYRITKARGPGVVEVVADAMDSFVKWYGDACDVYN